MDKPEFNDIILGGDLNWDMRRNSGFSQCMKDFTCPVGLVSVWEKIKVDYTHIHTDLLSTSTLDHFLVNQRLLDLIQDAGPILLEDNLSRHSPIMLKINVGSIPVKRKVNLRLKPRRRA